MIERGRGDPSLVATGIVDLACGRESIEAEVAAFALAEFLDIQRRLATQKR